MRTRRRYRRVSNKRRRRGSRIRRNTRRRQRAGSFGILKKKSDQKLRDELDAIKIPGEEEERRTRFQEELGRNKFGAVLSSTKGSLEERGYRLGQNAENAAKIGSRGEEQYRNASELKNKLENSNWFNFFKK